MASPFSVSVSPFSSAIVVKAMLKAILSKTAPPHKCMMYAIRKVAPGDRFS